MSPSVSSVAVVVENTCETSSVRIGVVESDVDIGVVRRSAISNCKETHQRERSDSWL